MEKYSIIADEQVLKEFIEWLPELKEEEVYYVCLFSRKKYDVVERHGVSRDKDQLKRFTTLKKDMYKKIRQLELEYGAYTHKDGSPVSQESLAVYVTLNPRSQIRAAKSLLVELANKVTQKYDNYNVHQLALSNIHKAKARTCWVDFDFDYSVAEEVWLRMEQANGFIKIYPHLSSRDRYGLYIKDKVESALLANSGAAYPYDLTLRFLQTRGGFHVLVNPELAPEIVRKVWFKAISSLPGCDQSGDNMIPVPGCYQGMFIPKFER